MARRHGGGEGAQPSGIRGSAEGTRRTVRLSELLPEARFVGCDDIVARGVIKGVVESGHKPSEKIAIFRIPGSWETEGFKILQHYGVEYCDRTVSMYEAAGRAVAKMKNA